MDAGPEHPNPTSARDYATGQLFAAAPDVATVQLRALVDGQPGAWFSGQVHEGYVYVPLLEAGPVPLDDQGGPQVKFERRAFDRDGAPVRIKG